MKALRWIMPSGGTGVNDFHESLWQVSTHAGDGSGKRRASLADTLSRPLAAKLFLSIVIQREWLLRSQLTTPKPVAER